MSPDTTPAPAGRPYKRRILIINGPFQYKFITVVMACVAVAIAIIAVDMFSSLGRYVSESAPQGLDMKAIYQDSWAALLVKVMVYMSGVFVVSMVVSHKVAGPLFRFEKSAEEVAKGNLTVRVFLRKGDELGGFRESFNGMVDALREKVAQDASRAQAAKRLLEELAGDAGLPEAAREKARKALAEASSIGGRFKLS